MASSFSMVWPEFVDRRGVGAHGGMLVRGARLAFASSAGPRTAARKEKYAFPGRCRSPLQGAGSPGPRRGSRQSPATTPSILMATGQRSPRKLPAPAPPTPWRPR